MKKKLIAGMVLTAMLLVVFFAVSSCGSKTEYAEDELYQVYYKSADGNSLVSIPIGTHMDYPGSIVADLLAQMQTQIPNQPDMVPAIPQSLTIQDTDMNIKSFVIIDFGSEYLKLSRSDELLCRAAITLTLTQVEGVENVEIRVNGRPIKDSEDNEVGSMNVNSFITDSSKRLSQEKIRAIIYYIDDENDKLEPNQLTNLSSLKADGDEKEDISPENLILNYLQKTPEDESLKAPIAPDVKILNHSIKNGTCYVNFDKSFLLNSSKIVPELVIYGIVNSLCELNEVSNVQFLVEGRSDVKFANEISLAEPFGRNGSLVYTTD